ncbi:unnamed protein product [Timema podura]|uniref:CIDE-N domain-containing protein n=1 Tax=Timema podura TaxID=61482 RepID=A0ABN7PP60_TIMPD|nr:unnamed protein product [Timema podura]
MPLFTIVSSNRKDKVLVSGDTIDQVVATACKKLGLPSQQCKIVLDQNGALIDEDEFLSSLPILTEMMILNAEEEWVSKEESVCRRESILTPRNKDNQQESNSKSGALVTNAKLVGERRAPLSFPWSKLTDAMTEKLERGETLSAMEARDLRKILGLHMIWTLRDYKRSTVSTLLKIFGNKYPQALKIVDADGELLNDGIEAFIIRLYDHINYKKPSSEKRQKKRPHHSEEISEKENTPRLHMKERVYDEYGCVAYEVPLPEDETKETQESKRLQLLHIRNSMNDCDEIENLMTATCDEIDKLMKSTYATQRKDIIDRKGGLKEVLLKWPYLEEANYFLAHASLLFGKDVKKVWEEKVSLKGLVLLSVLEIEQKKKNQVGQKRTEARICMKEVIATANRASTNLRQETPKMLALFQLLPLFFLEDEKEIFCLVTVSS